MNIQDALEKFEKILIGIFLGWIGTIVFCLYVGLKYSFLRKAYNEVAIQVVTDRLPKPIPQEELKQIRSAIERSSPRWLKGEEILDIAIVKDSSGTWKTAK